MTFPATVETVTLTVGPVLEAAGRPRAGVALTARLATRVRITGSGSVVPSLVEARTDSRGIATLVLVATDSEGVDVTGWTYHLTCPGHITAGGIDVALPAAAPVVRVEDLVPTEASDGTVIHLPDDTSWVALTPHPTIPGLYIIAGGSILTESPDHPGLYSIGA